MCLRAGRTVAAVLLAVALAGCTDDTDSSEGGDASTEESTTSTRPTNDEAEDELIGVVLGSGEIEFVTTDGSRIGGLDLPADIFPTQPDISPDGTEIAFVGIRGEEGRLRVADLDGSNASDLDVGDSFSDGCPRWFDNGTRLLTRSSLTGTDGELRVVDLDGDVTPILMDVPANEVDCGDPVPSSDRIVFARHGADDSTTGIWSVRTDGSDLVPIVSMAGCSLVSPSVSPDGTQVAFAAACPDAADWGIWTVGVDGGEPEQIVGENDPATLSTATSQPADDGQVEPTDGVPASSIVRYGTPGWSPDGSRLAFMRTPPSTNLDQSVRVWTVELESGTVEQLLDEPSSMPTWTERRD